MRDKEQQKPQESFPVTLLTGALQLFSNIAPTPKSQSQPDLDESRKDTSHRNMRGF